MPVEPTAPSQTSRFGRLRNLVRMLIEYGRQLAGALQQPTQASDIADVTRSFGTTDIALILSRITRGLLRAAALDARLANRLAREPAEPAAPAALRTPSPRPPRTARPTDPAATPDPRLARLPTAEDIAAEVRRRPVGSVIADICRDLGIVPSNPLWRELSLAIIANGGSLAALFKDVCKRLSVWITNAPAADHPSPRPAPCPTIALAPATGPP